MTVSGETGNGTESLPAIDQVGFAINVLCSSLTVVGSLLVIFVVLFYGKARLQTQRLVLLLCVAHIPLTNMDFHPSWVPEPHDHGGFCVQVCISFTWRPLACLNFSITNDLTAFVLVCFTLSGCWPCRPRYDCWLLVCLPASLPAALPCQEFFRNVYAYICVTTASVNVKRPFLSICHRRAMQAAVFMGSRFVIAAYVGSDFDSHPTRPTGLQHALLRRSVPRWRGLPSSSLSHGRGL